MTRLLGPDPSARTSAPAGMREAVMQAGLRRRRIAFAGAGSACAVVVVTAAALLAGTAAGSDSLRIEQPAVGASAASAGPDIDAGGTPAFGTTAGTASTSQPQPGPSGAPASARPAAPAPSARPARSPGSGHGMHGPVARSDREFGQVCQGDQMMLGPGGVSTSGWCVMVAPPAARETTPYPTLTFTICRSSAKDSGALTFDTTQEVDFAISSSGKRLWTWSTGQRFARHRHVLHRGSSQCFDWETAWDWRDDRGQPVPRSGLRLTAWSTSAELRRSPASADFSG
jgi:hypothetical protein